MRAAILICLLAVGCRPQDDRTSLLCECFADAAYAAVKANTKADEDSSEKCCGKCNGTGKVRSGDGLAIVPCPCPDTCPCKSKGKK